MFKKTHWIKKLVLLLFALVPITTPLLVISCKPTEKIPLSEAVKVKNIGYIADFEYSTILQKFLLLNPEIQQTAEGEIYIGDIWYNHATFGIHPQFKKKSKYKGYLEVTFDSYISPLYEYDEQGECNVRLTHDNPWFRAEFEITKDFPEDRFNHGAQWISEFLKVTEDKSENIIGVNFELKKEVVSKKSLTYSFHIDSVVLPFINFEIN